MEGKHFLELETSSVETTLDDESRVFIVEACTPTILTPPMIEIELLLTTCAITSITKLTQLVVVRSDVCGPLLSYSSQVEYLRETPHPSL
jgi:hypothetical protein